MPKKGGNGADRLLLILAILAIAYTVYWVGYSNFRYYSFRGGWFDTGAEVLTFYYHLHWPGSIGGLQYLSFAEHVDPFELLLLPLFAIWQRPITLFLLQDISLVAAAFVAYFIGRDVLKNRYVGFALAIAFLISPAIRGITFYDFHPEAFIPLFYLLSFYFYMRSKRLLLFVSYALLLSVIETSVVVGASLLLGLLAYELVNFWRKEVSWKNLRGRLIPILLCAGITLAFYAFYSLTLGSLSSAYAGGAYASMPPFFKVLNFYQSQGRSLLNLFNFGHGFGLWFAALTIAGIAVLLFGFGPYTLRVPLATIVLLSPWLFEVLVLHNIVFPTFGNEYYAYAIGGAVVAACLGLVELGKIRKIDYHRVCFRIISFSIVLSIVALVLTVTYPPLNAINPVNWLSGSNASSELNALTGALPSNATIMAQPGIAAHLYTFRYTEMPPSVKLYAFSNGTFGEQNVSFYWFTPQYVIFDRQFPDYAFMNGSNVANFNVYQYMGSNYTEYASSGNMTIYRRN